MIARRSVLAGFAIATASRPRPAAAAAADITFASLIVGDELDGLACGSARDLSALAARLDSDARRSEAISQDEVKREVAHEVSRLAQRKGLADRITAALSSGSEAEVQEVLLAALGMVLDLLSAPAAPFGFGTVRGHRFPTPEGALAVQHLRWIPRDGTAHESIVLTDRVRLLILNDEAMLEGARRLAPPAVHEAAKRLVLGAYQALAVLSLPRLVTSAATEEEGKNRGSLVAAYIRAVLGALSDLDCTCSLGLTDARSYRDFRRAHYIAQAWLPATLSRLGGGCLVSDLR